MPSELYHEIMAQKGSFERLIGRIPGFKGYQEKEARRQADEMLRDYLAGEIARTLRMFENVERTVLNKGGLAYMSRMREVKSKINAYYDRVRTAAPKYSGMWASLKVTEDVLDRIYTFDEAQLRFVDQFETAIQALETAIEAGEDFTPALEAVYDSAVRANDAFELRDDELTNFDNN